MADLGHTVDPGGTGDYVSLNALLAAQAQDLTDGGGDTYTATCITTNGNPDTAVVSDSGWTTGIGNELTFLVDPAHRHDGKYNTAKFRVERSLDGFLLSSDAVEVIGMQIQLTRSSGTTTRRGLNFSGGSTLLVEKVIIQGVLSGTTSNNRALEKASGTVIIINSTIYGFDVNSANAILHLGGTTTAYNLTVANNISGFTRATATFNCYNCIAYGNTSNFVNSPTGDYNLTDDASAPGGNSVHNATLTFVNDGVDFHLVVTDTDAINAGTDNPSSGLYLDDIDGDARSSPWDIGSDEFVSVDANAPTADLQGPLVGPLGGPLMFRFIGV